MNTEALLAKLKRLTAEARAQDKELCEESMDFRLEFAEMPSPESTQSAVQIESIVLRRLRPVLAIKSGTTELVFTEKSDSDVWKKRLADAKANLDSAIRSVGRVELEGGRLDWVGTGWLIADNILVTNRHVANEFALRKGKGFAFRTGPNGPMSARTDFLQEIGNQAKLEFKLIRPLHIEEEPGPDVSFFEVEQTSANSRLTSPIVLADRIVESAGVATIGYPAYDSRIPEPGLMEELYGKIYDKKRLAPGAVTRVEQTRLLHNCTTLGGNSGSVVLDLDTGRALGLHFSGSFLATNYAVRADVVANLLQRVRTGRTRREAAPPPAPAAVTVRSSAMTDSNGGDTTITVPLTITVSLGSQRSDLGFYRQDPGDVDDVSASTEIEGEEGRAQDYADREGYNSDFLGKKAIVPLPTVERDADDILEYSNGGETDHVLRYTHYSVVVSRSRRMCFFSAVNIDGNLSKKSARVSWKWDPRIPRSQQIMNECYGPPPKFSRGHMSRREDPGWGKTAAVARSGNEDSMHVTNATPQMQAFNAPIWLELEDYALQHAREDEMKITVFTGPYFGKRDPKRYGVRIPLAFWKIIAFIHDDTGRLCATGYEMNQKQCLEPEEEFVFGAFTSPQLGVAAQVPIHAIESKSGIRFGKLASLDPLVGEVEGLGDRGAATPLLQLDQIRFLR